MRRITAVGLALLLLAAGCSDDDGDDDGDGDQQSGTSTTDAAGGVTLGPLVSGTGSVVDGTFVWTDYVYDDRGADTEPGDRTDIEAAGGDATYATGWRNEADIVQTQLGLDDEGRVTVRVVLETLTDPAVPVVVIGFDTDGEPTGQVGFGSWEPPGGLGLDQVATLRHGGGELVTTIDEGAESGIESHPIEVTVDAGANTLEAALPIRPDGATWRAFAGATTAADADRASPHDLAFVGDEPEYRWQDDIQADLLAGDGDAADAMAEVDFAALAEGGTDLADATAPGFHTYLYESDLDLGEGVAPAEEDGFEYRGPYQPYLVWIPDDGPGEGEAMTVFLHGLTQNHLGSVLSPDGTYLGTGRPLSEERHLLEQYARDGLDFPPHNLTIWPLARGEGLRYRGIAEQDVLDVLADATERFAPDPDRIILSGGSMGGIGAFRLGALHPDRFSVVAPLIGLATEDTVPLLTNLWNVPVRQINGAQDPLIDADGAAATTDRMDQYELAYRAWMLDQRGHEAGGFVYDCVFASLPELERVTAPARVVYTVDPAQFVSDPDSGLELTYEGAHWVSGMVPVGNGLATVDASSTALGPTGFEAEHIDRRGGSGPDGGDLCDPDADVHTDDTWRERAVERTPVDDTGVRATLEAELTDLEAVTLDLAAAGLAVGDTVEIAADRPAEVTLTGLEPGQAVTAGDDELTADDDGVLTVSVPAVPTTLTL